MPTEVRKHPRIQLRLPVMFFGDHIQGTGCITTLSQGGCTIDSLVSVAPGVALRLQITLPENEGPLEVTLAIVRWAAGDQLGVEFIMISAEAQEHLRRFLSNL